MTQRNNKKKKKTDPGEWRRDGVVLKQLFWRYSHNSESESKVHKEITLKNGQGMVNCL
jgi:hypothetical protein